MSGLDSHYCGNALELFILKWHPNATLGCCSDHQLEPVADKAREQQQPHVDLQSGSVICSRFGTHTHTQRQPRCKWIFTFQAQAVEVTYLANVQMLNCSREKSGLLSCHTGLGCVNLKSRRTGRQILW